MRVVFVLLVVVPYAIYPPSLFYGSSPPPLLPLPPISFVWVSALLVSFVWCGSAAK